MKFFIVLMAILALTSCSFMGALLNVETPEHKAQVQARKQYVAELNQKLDATANTVAKEGFGFKFEPNGRYSVSQEVATLINRLAIDYNSVVWQIENNGRYSMGEIDKKLIEDYMANRVLNGTGGFEYRPFRVTEYRLDMFKGQ